MEYPYEYDSDIRRKARIYAGRKITLGILNSMVLPIVTLMIMLIFNFDRLLADLSIEIWPEVPAVPFAILLLGIIVMIKLPLSVWSGWHYDRQMGLSKMTLPKWFKDHLKGVLLLFLIGIPGFILIHWLLLNVSNWWFSLGIISLAITLLFSFIFPILLFPLFYSSRPLDDEAQIERINAIAERSGIRNIENILVAKESSRSTRSNAFFAGLGSTKRIVLFDNLLDDFHPDEVEVVIGHEMGHYANKDIHRSLLLETIIIFPLLYITFRSIELLAPNYFSTSVLAMEAVVMLILIYSLIQLPLIPLLNAHSRWREREADRFALEFVRNPEAQISMGKRMADRNLALDDPHWLLEVLLWTHPSVKKRIEHASIYLAKYSNIREGVQSPSSLSR